MNRLAAAAALALSACGNYSTDDLVFWAALPRREELALAVPDAAATAQVDGLGRLVQPLCALGPAEVWLKARPTSDGLNRGVEWILGLVDVVRHHPPTRRDPDLRVWGPFDDEQHPGREILVSMARSERGDGTPAYAYVFAARPDGQGEWQPIIEGSFVGASARRGSGELTVHFDVLRALGMTDDADAPGGEMAVRYDRSGDPVLIDLVLRTGGFGVEQFDYAYQGRADGSGFFRYAFTSARGEQLDVRARYTAASAGRAEVYFRAAPGAAEALVFTTCWDALACLTFLDDPGGFSGVCAPARTPCFRGDASACPPFPP